MDENDDHSYPCGAMMVSDTAWRCALESDHGGDCVGQRDGYGTSDPGDDCLIVDGAEGLPCKGCGIIHGQSYNSMCPEQTPEKLHAALVAAEERIAELHGIALGRCNAELEVRIAELEQQRECDTGRLLVVFDQRDVAEAQLSDSAAALATAIATERLRSTVSANRQHNELAERIARKCNVKLAGRDQYIAEQDAQITELQAAITREVSRRREAERQSCDSYATQLADARKALREIAELKWIVADFPDAIRIATEALAKLDQFREPTKMHKSAHDDAMEPKLKDDKCKRCRGFGGTKGAPNAPWEQVDCVDCGGTGRLAELEPKP